MLMGGQSPDHVLRQCSRSASIQCSSGKSMVMRQVEDQAGEMCQWVIFGLRIREVGDEMLMHVM